MAGRADVGEIVAGEPMPADRCAANEAAGPITYLTSFDFSATGTIVDVLVADERGYYDELCLDVEVQPSFSTDNYPLVAGGDAQFASGGSFSEVVSFGAANDAEFVVVAVEGHTPIDTLILEAGRRRRARPTSPGATIGVKGGSRRASPPCSPKPGSSRATDYDTVLLDGFDPLAHIAIDDIDGFPGYLSNEPGQLERAGIDVRHCSRPATSGVPGSFAVLYTTRQFADEHPTAVQDFVRATMRGLADALADPEAAVATSMARAEAGGNPNFLTAGGRDVPLDDGERADPRRHARPASRSARSRSGPLQDEIDAYADVGLFPDGAPDVGPFLEPVADRRRVRRRRRHRHLARLTAHENAGSRCWRPTSGASGSPTRGDALADVGDGPAVRREVRVVQLVPRDRHRHGGARERPTSRTGPRASC